MDWAGRKLELVSGVEGHGLCRGGAIAGALRRQRSEGKVARGAASYRAPIREVRIGVRVPFVDLQGQYQSLREEVGEALQRVLDETQLVLGPSVAAFETEFARYCRAAHAVGVGSGTDALYLALRACGVGPDDEVITVSHSFIATAGAIRMLGAVPVYVDVDPATYTLDPARIEPAISARTRAIVPVHLYGQLADMESIMSIAARHGLHVVEDACQAHGAEDRGHRAGSIGDAAAFSFYASKNLGAYGDAGMVTTNSSLIADRVRLWRDHGSAHKYEHQEWGVNSRLDELQAAVLQVKLKHLEKWNEQRRAHASTYAALLEDLDLALPTVRPGAKHVFHLYVVQIEDRDRIRQVFSDRGVATGIHYPIPIHQQGAARGCGRIAGDLSVTEAVAGRILSLPMYPEVEQQQLEYVAASLRDVAVLL